MVRKRAHRRRSRNSMRALQEIKFSYPIALTRDLNQARAWLRSRARGSERFGLVGSSGAPRLKPVRVNVHGDLLVPQRQSGLAVTGRASNRIRHPGPRTRLDRRLPGCRVHVDGKWFHHAFRGIRWNNVNDDFRRGLG